MNWYKKAQIDKYSGKGMWTAMGWLTVPAIALLIGGSILDVNKKIEQDPEGLKQQVEQVQQEREPRQFQTEQPQEIDTTQQRSGENLYDMIERHEGKRNKVYSDTLGVPTIGIGFNLTRNDASQRLSNVGANLREVLNGKELTNEQIYTLFKEDVAIATSDAQSFLPGFDQQPESVKNVIINMAFNLGLNRLSRFNKFKQALENRDYQEAANQMINSKWYNQVGNRSKELTNIMRGV